MTAIIDAKKIKFHIIKLTLRNSDKRIHLMRQLLYRRHFVFVHGVHTMRMHSHNHLVSRIVSVKQSGRTEHMDNSITSRSEQLAQSIIIRILKITPNIEKTT